MKCSFGMQTTFMNNKINQQQRNSFSSCEISSNTASRLFETLKECKSGISELVLCSNQIDDACMKSLGEYIHENECLKSIKLNDNQITDEGVKILSTFMDSNSCLRTIDLSGNKGVTDESISLLLKIMESSNHLMIRVENTSIGDTSDTITRFATNLLSSQEGELDLSR